MNLSVTVRQKAFLDAGETEVLYGGAAQKTLSPILREQVNLLYELLISANLPQYQKDRIGAAHAAAMALLEEGDHE